MKVLIPLFFLICNITFYSVDSFSQDKIDCGTHIFDDEEFKKRMIYPTNECNFIVKANRTFQLSVHIAKDSLMPPVTTLAKIQTALNSLNDAFDPIKMNFEICFNEVMPDFHYAQWENTEDEEMTDLFHYIPNTINLYFVRTVTHDLYGVVDGYAFLPGGVDKVVIACDAAGNIDPITLIHEMGHFFGLVHTHETEFGIELADMSNCDVSGDLLCDTEADPNGQVNNQCEYQGPFTDSNNDFYTPPFDNYMSYYNGCTCKFTIGQFNRMVESYLTIRNYLW